MRRIVKDVVPDFWCKYLRKHPGERYDDLDKTAEGQQIRMRVHDHMLQHQKMLCCYCCRSIDVNNVEASHNEHIKPRAAFPDCSMDYGNLVVSCTPKPGKRLTCGMAKGRKYDPSKFVSPLSENCESHFSYLMDGRIRGNTEQGTYTIECLNLNERTLVEARKALYKNCCDLARYVGKKWVVSEYMQEKDGILPSFVDMVTYFYNRGDFDSGIVNNDNAT